MSHTKRIKVKGWDPGMDMTPVIAALERQVEEARAEIKRLRPRVGTILVKCEKCGDAEAQLTEAQADLALQVRRLGEQAKERMELQAQLKAVVEALRMALDALTDAEQYHSRACAKEGPHDHALLRKLQATIPSCDDAALAALEKPRQ